MRRGSGELSHASTGLVLLLLGCGGTSGTRSPEGGSAAVDGGPRTTDGAHRLADTGADTRTHRSPDAPGGMRAVDGGRGDVGHLEASPGDAWAFAPTLTLESLTQNNTSACGTGADPCASAWDPTRTVTYSGGSTYAGQMRTVTAFWDSAVPPGPQAPGSAYGHVSKVPVSALLPGHDVPVWVETQNWFGAGNGHIDNGEVSTRGAQMANQVADHISRGFAGQVLDWYGPGTTADLGLPTIQASAEASSGAYKFAVMIDKGYFTTCGETVRCLNDGLAYVATHYGVSPAYLKDAGGHPVVFFFINQYYPTEYGILTGPGVDAAGTVFEMYEPNGFPGKDPANTVGEYAWVNPADGAITTTTGAQGSFGWATDFGFKDLNSFFSAARLSSNPL